MQKSDIQSVLRKVAQDRRLWAEAQTKFNTSVEAIMARLLNEAAAAYMSAEEVAREAHMTPKRVRDLMRKNHLNPRDGKRLLARQAAEALHENAALLGIDPKKMDLTSPLAYLPMGEEMRQMVVDASVAPVTELPPRIAMEGALFCLHCEFLESQEDMDEGECRSCGCGSEQHVTVNVVEVAS